MTTCDPARVQLDLVDRLKRDRVDIRAIQNRQTEADRLLLDHIREARAYGVTWQVIADALGVTRQVAHGRYARLVGE